MHEQKRQSMGLPYMVLIYHILIDKDSFLRKLKSLNFFFFYFNKRSLLSLSGTDTLPYI
jgi:hypothetical protein